MTILFHNTTFDKIDVWKKTIKKYFKKNLTSDEIIIGMGAGSISN